MMGQNVSLKECQEMVTVDTADTKMNKWGQSDKLMGQLQIV